ncbi:MAG: hypothetical protein Q8N88_04230 [Nanoarchaeota archaeon]|nr:hypothetical protein [Nanoarchaeota archaeon]
MNCLLDRLSPGQRLDFEKAWLLLLKDRKKLADFERNQIIAWGKELKEMLSQQTDLIGNLLELMAFRERKREFEAKEGLSELPTEEIEKIFLKMVKEFRASLLPIGENYVTDFPVAEVPFELRAFGAVLRERKAREIKEKEEKNDL